MKIIRHEYFAPEHVCKAKHSMKRVTIIHIPSLQISLGVSTYYTCGPRNYMNEISFSSYGCLKEYYMFTCASAKCALHV